MGRRDHIVECALQIVAEGGFKALTHRAVDRAAGLVEGSTGNHFPRRADLVRAVTRRVGERDHQVFHELRASKVKSIEELSELLTQGVVRMTAPDYADLARVRLQRLPTGSDEVEELHSAVLRALEAALERLGASDIPVRARTVAALFDGMILHTVSVDARPLDEAALTAAFLHLLSRPLESSAVQ